MIELANCPQSVMYLTPFMGAIAGCKERVIGGTWTLLELGRNARNEATEDNGWPCLQAINLIKLALQTMLICGNSSISSNSHWTRHWGLNSVQIEQTNTSSHRHIEKAKSHLFDWLNLINNIAF